MMQFRIQGLIRVQAFRGAAMLGAATLGVAILGGCAVADGLNERSRIDYKSSTVAKTGPSLEVPPDLSSPRNDERFALPGRTDTTASGFQRDRATAKPVTTSPSDLLPSIDGARVERAGGQRWLVINQTPEKLWPLVREFWQESGFVIQIERPEAGILETDWAENRAKIPQDFIRATIGRVFDGAFSSGERDKFRTRLETGSGGTEIYISHRGLAEVQTGQFKETTKWENRPTDPELEIEFLRRLMIKFGADQQRAKAVVTQPAVAAAGASGTSASGATAVTSAGTSIAAANAERAKLVSDPVSGRVELVESFDRAWRRVGLALDRGGFTVEDRDRSQGVYFVRYIDPEVDARNTTNPGFFARMFSSDTAAASSRQYRVKVQGTADKTSISVQSRDGNPVASDADRQTAGKMLALLHEQLKI
jgi:outer membrane protein assembly factor BamC